MSVLHEIEQLLSGMSRAEKAQVLQWVVRDLGDAFPGIESRPDVVGGSAGVRCTRIPVWVLERARRLGLSEAEIIAAFPTLQPEDLRHAWVYVWTHRDEINRDIDENETA